MIIGGIIAGVLLVLVYFVSKFFVSTQRERCSLAALFSGATCLTTSGFLVNSVLGYFAAGIVLTIFSFLLGYETGE